MQRLMPGRATTRARCAGNLVALLLLLASARSAQAASPEASAAQALFDEGKALMARADYHLACSKFEESERLDPALGTLLNLADCREKEGKIASAWSLFRDAEGLLLRAGPADAEAVARERARALEGRVPRLLIAVAPGQPPALKIARSGTDVGPAQWATPIPLDPGEYRVTATAPGYAGWQSTVTLKEGAGTLSLTVPALVREVSAVPAGLVSHREGVDLPLAPADSASRPIPTASWVLGGVGIAALGTSFALGSWAKSKYDSADCPNHVCLSDAAFKQRQGARDQATAATVVFIGGALALGGGVLLWAARPSPSTPGAARLSLRAGPASLSLDGTL